MYSFEGEFRRKPQQSLGGASRKVQRDELLHKAQIERLQREEKRRTLNAAITIQSFVRGTFTRLREKRRTRSEFDEIVKHYDSSALLNSSLLNDIVAKLIHFYDERTDIDRLMTITQIFLRESASVSTALVENCQNWLFKFEKLLLFNLRRLKTSDSPSANIALPLRFVEVFTSFENYRRLTDDDNVLETNRIFSILEKIYSFLIKYDYFSILKILMHNRVPDSFIDSEMPPTPMASAILDLFNRIFLINSEKKIYFVQEFLRSLFTDELSPLLKHFLLPAISQPELISADVILAAVAPKSMELYLKPTYSLLYTFIYIIMKHANSLTEQQCIDYVFSLHYLLKSLPYEKYPEKNDHISDDDEDMVVDDIQSNAEVNEIVAMVNDIRHVNVLLNIDSEKGFYKCIGPLCCLCHLLLSQHKLAIHNYRLLYTLAFKPQFLRMLWRSILSTFPATVFSSPSLLLQVIAQGLPINISDQETFLPQLIVFCSFLNYVLSTLHDFEFYGTSKEGNSTNMMPFELRELASISVMLKDVSMGLVELAYPERKATDFANVHDGSQLDKFDRLGNIKLWIHLFKAVISLLRQLYSRDCRQKFCAEGSWVASKPFPNLFKSVREFYFTQASLFGYEPFVGLRHMTREELQVEGPPLSAIEVRHIAVLRELPFAIPFIDRFKILQSLMLRDKHENQVDVHNYNAGPRISITVRRRYIYEDAYACFRATQVSIKHKVLVHLINEAGVEEPGVDGGGIFREFLNELLKTCFDPNRGFFTMTQDNLLYPNPHVHRVFPDFAMHYYFIGRILGKAIYEHMLIEVPLAAFFLAKILSRHQSHVDIHFLASLDPVLYRNLLYLKTYEGDMTDLGLDFTVVNSEFGETEIVELKPNGRNIPVTESNKIKYIHLMADYKLNKQINAQCKAFKKGLANVLDLEWLYMFDPNELQTLISGAQTPIDIDDLRAHTCYAGGYSPEHPVIHKFWRIIETFDEDLKHKLLKFVTSCSRAPLLGFRELSPPFCIQNAGREDRLPTASTCMNLLKLPELDNEELLKTKILYAIEAGAGFELS